MLLNIYQGMLDMVTKGASNGIPSLHARKRRNMVREMSDQLLDAPNKPVDDEESDKSDDVTDDEIEPESRPVPNVQAEQFVQPPAVQRSQLLVNNFVEDASNSTVQELSGPTHYVTENEAVGWVYKGVSC